MAGALRDKDERGVGDFLDCFADLSLELLVLQLKLGNGDQTGLELG